MDSGKPLGKIALENLTQTKMPWFLYLQINSFMNNPQIKKTSEDRNQTKK